MKGRVLRVILPLLAVGGFAYAVFFTLVLAKREPPQSRPLAMPAESRFSATISASGLIEASSRNIEIGSFLSGVVHEVPVTEGDRVKAGDRLFVLDRRAAEADLLVASRELATAEARVQEGVIALADQEDQLRRAERLKPGVVVSEDRLIRLRFAEQAARAVLEAARAEADAARARRAAAAVTLDQLTVRAPIDGRVLKVNVRPGAFVAAGANVEPPLLLGDDHVLHVRVQVDENDIWRLRPGATAEAVVRGNREIRFPLAFVRVEPYVTPKRSLTGDTSERVDTRILEVIYSFDPAGLPVFIGQQVDAFIATDITSAGPPP
ncbi:MAG: efflux RND transporter periplasmic adaptor subunit [Rhodospirillales bacterium]|nr:efflux RND transporter periplasmic adaptor subunit [Rhodospirillales bacterium]